MGDGGSAVAAAAGTPPPPPLVSSRRQRLCSSDLNAMGFEARASPRGGVPSAPPSLLSSMAMRSLPSSSSLATFASVFSRALSSLLNR